MRSNFHQTDRRTPPHRWLRASVVSLGWAAAAATFTSAAVAQAVPAPATSSLQIYGILSVGVAKVNNVGGESRGHVQNALNFPNYIGFRGNEDLGDGMTAQFALASNVNVPTGVAGQGAAFWNKNSWVGLGNRAWGSIAVGRNDEFSNEQCLTGVLCWSGLIYNLHPGNLDRIGGGQLANMVKYISPDMGPVRFRTYYAFADRSTGTHAGRAIGLEGIYRSKDLNVTATYESLNGASITPASPTVGIGLTKFFAQNATPTTTFALDKQDIYVLGVRYGIGAFLIYGLASDVVFTYRGDKESMKTFETGLTYSLSQPLSLTGACFQSKLATSTWNTCGLTLTYVFSKRTSVFLADSGQRTSGPFQQAQMFQVSGPSSTQAQNAVALGMRHSF